MPRCVLVFTLLAVLPLSTMSFAAQQQRSGTPDEQRACTRDVERFCRSVMDQSDLIILACLKENRPKISAACDQVLKDHYQ
jgi:hypothetical protein